MHLVKKTGNVGKTGRAEWYWQGGLLGELSGRHRSYSKVFCRPPAFCQPEDWIQPVLFSDTPSSSISFQCIQAQRFVLEMLSFVNLAFISVGCLSCFIAFLSRRQSQHLTLGVLFSTPLLLNEAKEILINKPTRFYNGLGCVSASLWKGDEVNRASVWNTGLVNKPRQGGVRGGSACACVGQHRCYQSCSKGDAGVMNRIPRSLCYPGLFWRWSSQAMQNSSLGFWGLERWGGKQKASQEFRDGMIGKK